MEKEHDRGEFVFALCLVLFGFLPVSGLLSGIMYDKSLRESLFWFVVNILLLLLAIRCDWIFIKYAYRVYRREFTGIRDIMRTIRSLWLEMKDEIKNA